MASMLDPTTMPCINDPRYRRHTLNDYPSIIAICLKCGARNLVANVDTKTVIDPKYPHTCEPKPVRMIGD